MILVDQSPLGTTRRANPVTYSRPSTRSASCSPQTPLARLRGYTAATFSFNVAGGRCETCNGEGFEKVEMQFLSDVYVTCPSCNGTRFRAEVLEVTLQAEDRSATCSTSPCDEAVAFFADEPEVVRAAAAAASTSASTICASASR